LGKDKLRDFSNPQKLPLTNDIVPTDILGGFRQTYALAENNKILYGFGSNRCCELGLKTEENIIASPVTIPLQNLEISLPILKIVSGQKFMIILD